MTRRPVAAAAASAPFGGQGPATRVPRGGAPSSRCDGIWVPCWSAHSGTRNRIDTEATLHALAVPAPRYAETGVSFRAACGARVRWRDSGGRFDAADPRSCRKCAKALAT